MACGVVTALLPIELSSPLVCYTCQRCAEDPLLCAEKASLISGISRWGTGRCAVGGGTTAGMITAAELAACPGRVIGGALTWASGAEELLSDCCSGGGCEVAMYSAGISGTAGVIEPSRGAACAAPPRVRRCRLV